MLHSLECMNLGSIKTLEMLDKACNPERAEAAIDLADKTNNLWRMLDDILGPMVTLEYIAEIVIMSSSSFFGTSLMNVYKDGRFQPLAFGLGGMGVLATVAGFVRIMRYALEDIIEFAYTIKNMSSGLQ